MKSLSGRRAVLLVSLVSLLACFCAVSGAFANVMPTVTTTLTLDQVIPTGNTGATTTVAVQATKLGQHADYTVEMKFGYGATGTVTDIKYGPYEDQATYPQPSSPWETLKNVVVKSPPGLVGNPNAVPFADRCDLSTFELAICPDSATIGTFGIKAIQFGETEEIGGPDYFAPGDGGLFIPIGIPGVKNMAGSFTKVSLLKTDPEVPAMIGIHVQPPFSFYPIRTVLKAEPDTKGDLRLVTSTPDGIANQLAAGVNSDDPLPGTPMANLRIDYMRLKLFGRLPSGRAFMTNPTQCKPWSTQIWANAHKVNANVDADPLGTGASDYASGNVNSVMPDCTNMDEVPFPIKGDVAISTPDRNTSPAFDFTITNPGVQSDGDDVATSPRKVVTTIPAAINVDVSQLGRVCQVADFNADTCPATSRVGTVKIETPLLLPGLAGDVYLVKQNANTGLPDLGLRLRGAISFTQRGVNRYVGETFNQIETTFDNIPQIGFSKLTFHLFGGPDGLLRSLKCPTYNKAPAVPNFTYNFTAWSGATASSTTPLNMTNCFGIQELRPYKKCLHGFLPVRPNYQSRSRVERVDLKVDGRFVKSSRRTPFRFDIQLRKIKKKLKAGKKHTLELRAVYDDGTVSKKQAKFRTCK